MECSKCGVSENLAKLYDTISLKGISKVCESCSRRQNLTLIKKPTEVQIKQAEKRKTVYERLSSAAGIDIKKADFRNPVKSATKNAEDISLKDLVDKNFNKGLSRDAKKREDLIPNFHWAIMRARRSKKLTQEQLAKELHESEAAIKMAEKGVLPKNENAFLNKLENFLGIKISKREIPKQISREEIIRPALETQIKEEELHEPVDPFGDEDKELEKIAERAEKVKKELEIEEDPEEDIDFSPISTKSLSIADLRALKETKEKEVFKSPIKEKTDLSEEEINNILFGKKAEK